MVVMEKLITRLAKEVHLEVGKGLLFILLTFFFMGSEEIPQDVTISHILGYNFQALRYFRANLR